MSVNVKKIIGLYAVALALLMLITGWQIGYAQESVADDVDVSDAAGVNDANVITAPTAGSVVSGIVEVQGQASDPKFRRVEIGLLLFGNEKAATFIGRMLSEVNGSILAFDSTRYPDGDHTLRMRVVRSDGNYNEYYTPITIRNAGASAADPNGITNVRPTVDGAVSGGMRITGVAYDPALAKWQVLLLPFGKAEGASVLSEGTRTFLQAGTLAGFVDTTAFPDGEHILRLRIIKSDRTFRDYDLPLVINNDRPHNTAANGFARLSDGQVLSGTVRIQGVADHPQFVKWQLDLLLNNDANRATFLNWSGFAVAQTAQLVRLDTTLFPNGEHTLRLRVVRKDYNYEEYLVKIVIAN